jgi:hypothetical protein
VVGPALDDVEVAYGVAVVLPLFLEDRVQARQGGLNTIRVMGVPARRGQVVRGEGGDEVAHHRDAVCSSLEHLVVGRAVRCSDRRLEAVVLGAGVRQAERVERRFELEDGATQPHVRGVDQVAQGLRERPLPVDGHVDRAGRHRRDALERGRPGALERGPGRVQAGRIRGTSLGASGEAAVELALDEGEDVDSVDEQEALAFEQPRRVDLGCLHQDAAHHEAGQV